MTAMKPHLLVACAAWCAVWVGTGASSRTLAQTSYPMLMSLKPVAAQAGRTSQHTIKSRYSMYGASQVLVSGDGVTGRILHPEPKEGDEKKEPNLQAMTVEFTVEDGALPGVRDFRVGTPRGVSTIGQVVIVSNPVVAESSDNNSPDQATEVTMPCTICGTIERAEDVDYYKFQVAKGDALSFHVRAMRLQNRIHDLQQHIDPILTLKNAAGVTLAASDNHFYGDPFLGYTFDRGGEYLLEIRDVRYQGNQYWEYSIEVSNQPFLSNVYPLAVAARKATEVEMIGFNLPKSPTTAVSLSSDGAPGTTRRRLTLGDTVTNPVPMIVSDLPLVHESEWNNGTIEQAQPIDVPSGINGRIEAEGDIDCFAFSAHKGDRLSFEVIARRQQSGLDSQLRILDEQGRQLVLNDDMRLGKRGYSDSWIENWAAPDDGKYIMEVRDLHLRGGPSFVYFLQVTRSQPYFELYADTDKTPLTPGTAGVVFVRAVRKNGFNGEIQLHIDHLPPKVKASCGRILAGKGQDGCIVLQAAPGANRAVSNVPIYGTATVEAEDGSQRQLTREAVIYQETYQPGGGRGHWPVIMHTVSVAAPSDVLEVQLSDYDIVLRPGESRKIDVTIRRAEGFNKNVTLDVIYKHLNRVYGNCLPEGVTLDAPNSKTLLTAGATEGQLTLKAADNALPVERQQFAVMANVSLNFVMKATYSSKPAFVTVE